MRKTQFNDSYDIKYQNESDTTCSSIVKIVSILTENNKMKSNHNRHQNQFLFRCFSSSPTNKEKYPVNSPDKVIFNKAKQIIKTEKKKNKTYAALNSNSTKSSLSNNTTKKMFNRQVEYKNTNIRKEIIGYATLYTQRNQRTCSNGQINIKRKINDKDVNKLFKYSSTINTKNPFPYSNYASLLSVRKRMHETLYK